MPTSIGPDSGLFDMPVDPNYTSIEYVQASEHQVLLIHLCDMRSPSMLSYYYRLKFSYNSAFLVLYFGICMDPNFAVIV